MTNSVTTCQISHLPIAHGRVVAMLVWRDIFDPFNWHPASAAIRGSYFDDGDCLHEIDNDPVTTEFFRLLGHDDIEEAIAQFRHNGTPRAFTDIGRDKKETVIDIVMFDESMFDRAVKKVAHLSDNHLDFANQWTDVIHAIKNKTDNIARYGQTEDGTGSSDLADMARRDLADAWNHLHPNTEIEIILRMMTNFIQDAPVAAYHTMLVDAIQAGDKDRINALRDKLIELARIWVAMRDARSDWCRIQSSSQDYATVTPVRLTIAKATIAAAIKGAIKRRLYDIHFYLRYRLPLRLRRRR